MLVVRHGQRAASRANNIQQDRSRLDQGSALAPAETFKSQCVDNGTGTVTGNAIRKATDSIADFLRLESAGGLLLVAAAALALICSNSPLRHAYDDLL